LCIEATILCQSFRNSQKCICKAYHTQASSTTDTLCILSEILRGSNFKSSRTRKKTIIFYRVLYRSETIPHCIFNLVDGMLIWGFDKNRARKWILNIFDKSIFLFSKDLLVDVSSKTEAK